MLGSIVHAARFVAAVQRDFHHAGAGFARHFELREFGLHRLHALLHLLRLLHQIRQTFHGFLSASLTV